MVIVAAMLWLFGGARANGENRKAFDDSKGEDAMKGDSMMKHFGMDKESNMMFVI